MSNVIVIGIVAAIVAAAARYIYKEKKKGAVCIGCPNSGCCKGACSGCHCGDTQ